MTTGFSNVRTGEKCLESGIYRPEYKNDYTVNLIIFKDEIFPTYEDDTETVWVQFRPLFSESQIEDAQSVLRESVRRYKHQIERQKIWQGIM